MARVNTSWEVLPHLPIEKLEDNLWRVQGTIRGMALKRVMALIRLDDGRVVVHYITQSTGGPRVSRLFRLFAVKERAAFAAHLDRLADTPDLIRIIVSHHRMITERPGDVLRGVAASLG